MEKGTPIGSQTLTYIPNWAQSWRVPFPCSSDLPLHRGHPNECPLLRLLPLEHTADLTFQARPSPGKPHHICSGFLISQPGGSGNPKISQKSILSDSRRATGFQGCLFQYIPGPFLPLPSSPSVPFSLPHVPSCGENTECLSREAPDPQEVSSGLERIPAPGPPGWA